MPTNKEPLVTVFIPSYNNALYIGEAIQSVIDQTYKNIQLIITEDCSTDNSVEIIKKYGKKCRARFSDYKFFQNEKNIGLVKTLNKYFPYFQGKYYCGLGSDDIFEKTKIAKQVFCFARLKQNVAVIYSDGYIIDSNGVKLRDSRGWKHLARVSLCRQANENTGFENYKLFFTRGQFLPAPTMMFRVAVIREVGGYDSRVTLEDIDILLKILKKYEVRYIDERLVLYRVHGNNYVKKYPDKYIRSKLKLLIREREYCYRNKIMDLWCTGLYDACTYRFSLRNSIGVLGLLLKSGSLFWLLPWCACKIFARLRHSLARSHDIK